MSFTNDPPAAGRDRPLRRLFETGRVRQPVSLVRSDYYEDSLREDQKRQAKANARALRDQLTLAVDGRDLLLRLPADHAKSARGTGTLYRASDPKADRDVALSPSPEGTQRISLDGLSSGQWLVQLRWTVGQRDFYAEQEVGLK